MSGKGRRPVLAANLTTTLSPTDAVTITNHTAFHSTRMDGDGTYQEVNNATAFGSLIHFQFLGIQTFTNSTDPICAYRRYSAFTRDINTRSSRQVGRAGQLRRSIPRSGRRRTKQYSARGTLRRACPTDKPLTFSRMRRSDAPTRPSTQPVRRIIMRLEAARNTGRDPRPLALSYARTTTSTLRSLSAHSSRSPELCRRRILVRS